MVNKIGIVTPSHYFHFQVYFESGRQANPGSLNFNIATGPASQIRTWKVSQSYSTFYVCVQLNTHEFFQTNDDD